MKDSAVQKLAAYSTIKGMFDSRQYKHQYFILAEFIKFIIVEHNLSSFSILQMGELLKSDLCRDGYLRTKDLLRPAGPATSRHTRYTERQ